MEDLILEVRSNPLELRELIEDSKKYDILVNYLIELLARDTTYDIKENIKTILKCLGEE